MKERPILFQGAMVRALLAGTKTQTRRVLKQATGPSLSVGIEDEPGVAELSWLWGDGPGHDVHETIKKVSCPYGQPGDRLWVRETFYAFGRWETRFSTKKGREEWHFIDMTVECGKWYFYAATSAPDAEMFRRTSVTPMWWKRPAIFMPRAASRIQLENTEVRVQRLQEISEADALAEGIQPHRKGGWHAEQPPDGIEGTNHFGFKTPRDAYRDLWDSINSKKRTVNVEGQDFTAPGAAWSDNPWVWAVSFERVKP